MKPRLIYDGDCGFCRRWIARWQSLTEERVDFAPYQEVGGQYPQISLKDFEASVQLVETDGKVYQGAEAVFRTLTYAPHRKWLLWAYQRVPGFAFTSEAFYRIVARNRIFFSHLTHWLWGPRLEPPTYSFSRSLFLRLLGGIYLIAFVSFWVQLEGLVGENGILPAVSFFEAVRNQTGPERYWFLPTLAWINASDVFLHGMCAAGVLLSLVVIGGSSKIKMESDPISFFFLWLLYLSLTVAGQDFMHFQWDILLLEAGFLAIFFSFTPPLRAGAGYTPGVLWLYKWLLFRLMFFSGMVKLMSGDPAWQNLTALTFHYETQPLPTWIGWYAHQLPAWFQKFSCAVMFGIEILIPFLIFAPRRPRLFACAVLVGFQILIPLTGNYCFFNLLTIALCLLLVDDGVWVRLHSVIARSGATKQSLDQKIASPAKNRGGLAMTSWLITPLAAVILIVTTMQFARLFRFRVDWPAPLISLYQAVAPFRSINSYGLFAVMTTSRPEIVIEGSHNQVTWKPYEFQWKPGDLKGRPRFVAPHQPRLDWQMWFAALGNIRREPWVLNLMSRLLEGKEEVLALFRKNPFPDAPPKYVRAVVYDYRFTDLETKRGEGTWWRREYGGLYAPVMSLKSSS